MTSSLMKFISGGSEQLNKGIRNEVNAMRKAALQEKQAKQAAGLAAFKYAGDVNLQKMREASELKLQGVRGKQKLREVEATQEAKAKYGTGLGGGTARLVEAIADEMDITKVEAYDLVKSAGPPKVVTFEDEYGNEQVQIINAAGVFSPKEWMEWTKQRRQQLTGSGGQPRRGGAGASAQQRQVSSEKSTAPKTMKDAAGNTWSVGPDGRPVMIEKAPTLASGKRPAGKVAMADEPMVEKPAEAPKPKPKKAEPKPEPKQKPKAEVSVKQTRSEFSRRKNTWRLWRNTSNPEQTKKTAQQWLTGNKQSLTPRQRKEADKILATMR